MSRKTTVAPLLAAILWTAPGSHASAERKADPTDLIVGSRVELAVKPTIEGNQQSSTIYLGRVKTVTGESVTLQDVTKTIRTESSTPVLRSIPYVKRYFRNIGIGQTHLGKKSVVILLDDIAGTEVVTPVEFRKRSASRARSADSRNAQRTP
jgi:hypothetical protein